MANIYEKSIDQFDKSLFKGKDLDLVNSVIKYLKDNDLIMSIEGSVKNNALKGSPRNYQDIDILVSNESDHDARYKSIIDLARIFFEKDYQNAPLFAKHITSFSQEGKLYVNTTIDNLFKIKRKDSKTKIEICFEKYDYRPKRITCHPGN
ncbi:MAG: hypothetical protein PHE43_03690 [Candidatus Nanoarchaeia archaeon]|nr:hypothetical protein [Candidatus Nanoarchaeia archaeon]